MLASGAADLIAVDNSSPDESASLVSRVFPGAEILRLDENRGFAAGANAGIARACTRYVLLLNPDVVIPEAGLPTLVDWMDEHPEVGVASPELISVNGSRGSPGFAYPSAATALLELTRLHRLLPTRTRGRILRGTYWGGGDQLDAGWVPGAAMIVRTAALADVGPLDEDFFMYGEDIEWCWRFRQHGWSVGVCSSVAFEHREGVSAHVRWGEAERAERVARGIIEACARGRGKASASAFALLTAVNLAIESIHPRRSGADRASTRAWLHAWWRGFQAFRNA